MGGLLLFFIIYLLIQINVSGNNGNCGCFGEHIKMTPMEAIIKNILMIVVGAIIYFLFEGWKLNANKFLLSFVAVSAITVPFMVNPVDYK